MNNMTSKTITWIPPSQRVGVDDDESHTGKIAAMFGGSSPSVPKSLFSRRSTEEIEKEYPGFNDNKVNTMNNTSADKGNTVSTPPGMTRKSSQGELETLSLKGRNNEVKQKFAEAAQAKTKAPVVRRRSLVAMDAKKPEKKNTPNITVSPDVPKTVAQVLKIARDPPSKAKEAEDAKSSRLAASPKLGKRSMTVSSGSSGLHKEKNLTTSRSVSSLIKRKTSGNICEVCDKSVFEMEKLKADGKLFHKWCFRCAECNKTCSTSTYAALNNKIYCKPCFKKLFKLKGNYDDGFGTKQHKMKWDERAE